MKSSLHNHKNPFIRKGFALALSLPRSALRLLAKPSNYSERPPILCNSIPKSGTHLLKQIALGFSQNRDFGAFLASTPTLTQIERSPEEIRRRIRSIAPGELIRAHLFYSQNFHESLKDINVVHFFLYRDPRDVAISEAHYLRTGNRWHRFHPMFAATKDMNEAIMLSIRGGRDEKSGLMMGNITQRYAKYTGWLSRPEVFSVRFEELVGNRDLRAKIEEIVAFHAAHYTGRDNSSFEALVSSALRAIQPKSSHTFRRGITGGWRNTLTPEHIAVLKQISGQLLIELGYESGLDW